MGFGFVGAAGLSIAGLAAEFPLGGKEGHNEAARFWGVVAIFVGAFTGAVLVLQTSRVVPLLLIAVLNGGAFLAVRAYFEETDGDCGLEPAHPD